MSMPAMPINYGWNKIYEVHLEYVISVHYLESKLFWY